MGYALHIGGKRFTLAHNVDISWLEDEIDDAMRSGGAWIDVPIQRGKSIRLYVSAEFPIHLSKNKLTGRAQTTD